MTAAQRLDRLEDAVRDLTTLVVEGQMSRVERYVGPGCSDAGRALMETLNAIEATREATKGA